MWPHGLLYVKILLILELLFCASCSSAAAAAATQTHQTTSDPCIKPQTPASNDLSHSALCTTVHCALCTCPSHCALACRIHCALALTILWCPGLPVPCSPRCDGDFSGVLQIQHFRLVCPPQVPCMKLSLLGGQTEMRCL